MRIATCAHNGKYWNSKPGVSKLIQLLCTRRIGEWPVRGKSIPEQDRSARPARYIPASTTYQVLTARMPHSMTMRGSVSFWPRIISTSLHRKTEDTHANQETYRKSTLSSEIALQANR